MWFLVVFFIPVAGLIAYFVKRRETPKSAEAALLGNIIEVGPFLLYIALIICAGLSINIG